MALKPLVTVIGTTGVGKSRLAIELSLALSGHGRGHGWHSAKVINSDSMQVYSGADVITNKVPESERQGVKHLLMGFKEPGEQYVVGQWVNDAVREIDELHRQSTLPVVVGGTAYWMQHLIFPNRLASFENRLTSQDYGRLTPADPSPALKKAMLSLPGPLLDLFMNLPDRPDQGQAFALHVLLSTLDPPMASRWHWKDTRKVLRSLQIIKEKGLLASEVMEQQARCVYAPRYSTLIFWLYSTPDLLNGRLDARVDDMIQQGLLEDVRMLQQIASGPNFIQTEAPRVDTTSGIFQAIGFKEFSTYVSSTSPSPKHFQESAERTKISNRQYARRQVQWIRNKLLPAVNAANNSGQTTPVFLLNVADLENWDVEVRSLAVQILHDFLEEKELPNPRSISQIANSLLDIKEEIKDPTAALIARRKVICDICTTNTEQPMMVDEGQEWQDHIQSRKHRRLRRERDRPKPSRPKEQKMASTNSLDLDDDLDLDFGADVSGT